MARLPRLRLPAPAAVVVERFDLAVDAGFDRLRGRPLVDRVFYSASALGDFSLLWLLLGAAQGLRSSHELRGAVRVGAVLGAESVLVNAGIKSLFRRERPVWQGPRPHRLRIPLTSSFPSGHATSGFCAATLLAEDDPVWPVWYLVAAVVAASRVHVRIHHASDVIGGAVVGLAIGRLARRLAPPPLAPANEPPRGTLTGATPPGGRIRRMRRVPATAGTTEPTGVS